jgi:hypothetical protein
MNFILNHNIEEAPGSIRTCPVHKKEFAQQVASNNIFSPEFLTK